VIQVAGSGPIPSVPGLRLVRVGRGKLTSPLPLGAFLTTASSSAVLISALEYHRAPLPPFLVAGDVRGLSSSSVLSPSYRSYAWVIPLERGTVHAWSVDSFTAAVDRARSEVEAAYNLRDVTAPVDELGAAADEARTAGRRLLLVGGEAAALLLAFAVLAATALRRDVEAAWRRLTWYGGRRWQLVLLTAAETATVALAATFVGWAGGTGIVALVADRAGSPIGPIIGHSVLGGGGLAAAAALAGGAALILLLTLRLPQVGIGGRSLTPVDVAALGALAAVGLALARGATGAESIGSQRGTGIFLLLLPVLIAFVLAVGSARLLVPLLQLLGRAGRRAPVPFRLAALSLARNPGRAAVVFTFLVVSVGLALFAAAYRATLVRGQSAEASYAVPADFVLGENLTQLVPVLGAAPLSRYSELGRAAPVVRLSGDVSRLESSGGFAVVGLPLRALPRLGGWRGDFSPLSRGELARRLAPSRALELQGVALPARARELVLPVSVRGDDLALSAQIQKRRGDFVSVRLGQTDGRRRVELRAPLPPTARGGRLVALTFDVTSTGLHGVPNGGYNVNPVARGTLRLGRMRPVPIDFDRWVGTTGVRQIAPGRLGYAVTTELESRFRARQTTDGAPLRILASPRLAHAAGAGGVVPLDIEGQRVDARVVGTVRRFPSVHGDVVVADAGSLATAMNADSPGSAVANEVWLWARDPARAQRALHRPPFDTLQLSSRRDLERSLRTEPLARGVLLTLEGAAVIALALALVGLLLGLVADLRDESGELLDLEAQGASPRTLQRHLRLRTFLLAGLALVGGVATGAILSGLVVRVVALTAQGTAPEPPLVLALDWRVLGLGLLAYVVAAVGLAAAATRTAFRGAVAGRFSEVGT
jgi:hypothetical protein